MRTASNVAIYRCSVGAGVDHFFTTDARCEGQNRENGGAPLGFVGLGPGR